MRVHCLKTTYNQTGRYRKSEHYEAHSAGSGAYDRLPAFVSLLLRASVNFWPSTFRAWER